METTMNSLNNTHYESVTNKLKELSNSSNETESVKYLSNCILEIYKRQDGYENIIENLSSLVNSQNELLCASLDALRKTTE